MSERTRPDARNVPSGSAPGRALPARETALRPSEPIMGAVGASGFSAPLGRSPLGAEEVRAEGTPATPGGEPPASAEIHDAQPASRAGFPDKPKRRSEDVGDQTQLGDESRASDAARELELGEQAQSADAGGDGSGDSGRPTLEGEAGDDDNTFKILSDPPESVQRTASPGAVVIIETPDSFVLEGRPEEEGHLAHSGKWGLFGGHVDKGEDPDVAAPRELREEIGLEPEGTLNFLWRGDYHKSQDKTGQQVTRNVSLYQTEISSTDRLAMKVGGELVTIPKTLEAVEQHQERLTDFAYQALKERLKTKALTEAVVADRSRLREEKIKQMRNVFDDDVEKKMRLFGATDKELSSSGEPDAGDGDKGNLSENNTDASLLQTPDGEIVDLVRLIEQTRGDADASINVGAFRPGDLIVFKDRTAEDEARGIVFEVTSTEWKDMVIDGQPTLQLRGKIYGDNLPETVADKEVTFRGSDFGFPVLSLHISPDIVATDRPPYFMTSEGEELTFSQYTYAETFRERNGLRPLDLNQLDSETRATIASHTELLDQFKQLVTLFGYDFQDRSPELHPKEHNLAFQDSRFLIDYQKGVGYGGNNELAILDLENDVWIKVSYLNSNNQDILQIGVAELAGLDLQEVFNYNSIIDASCINRAGAAMTTFTSSAHYGIEVVNYRPSEQDARDHLGVPNHTAGDIYEPNIRIIPDGQTQIIQDAVNTMYNVVEEEHPGLAERVNSSISSGTNSNGKRYIKLGDNIIHLDDPKVLLSDVIADITRKIVPHTEGEEFEESVADKSVIDYEALYQQLKAKNQRLAGGAFNIITEAWETIPLEDPHISDEELHPVGELATRIRSNLEREGHFQHLAVTAAQVRLPSQEHLTREYLNELAKARDRELARFAPERAPILQSLDEDSELIAYLHPNVLARAMMTNVFSDQEKERIAELKTDILATLNGIRVFEKFPSSQDCAYRQWIDEMIENGTMFHPESVAIKKLELNEMVFDPYEHQDKAIIHMPEATGTTKRMRQNLNLASLKIALIIINGERVSKSYE